MIRYICRRVILTALLLLGMSFPNFWLGTLLILLFSVTLGWLPSGGMTHFFWTPRGFFQTILPAIALSTGMVANFTRPAVTGLPKSAGKRARYSGK